MHASSFLPAAASLLLLAAPAVNAGLYPKSSAVLQINGKSYSKLIEKSPYTSIVEFYAPWCGHCKNLQPAYEKVAQSLQGMANVAAVDCDEESNKPFCGQMGVQGFPTLKMVRPSKKGGSPVVEDYRGERTAKAISAAVSAAINNHVVKVTDKDSDAFFQAQGPKAILLTEKGTTSSLMKAIAIDFLGVISVGQARSKETGTVEKLGIEKFPSLVLLPDGGADPVVYDGELKKEAMVGFLSQAGAPSSTAGKASTSKKEDAKPKAKSPKPESSEPAKPAKPAKLERVVGPPIPVSQNARELSKQCLNVNSRTCILAFVPKPLGEKGADLLNSIAAVHFKSKLANKKLFDAFEVPESNTAGRAVRERLQLPTNLELVAINARRGWWKHFESTDYSYENINAWMDEIKMGDGEKYQIPPGIVMNIVDEEEMKEREAKKKNDAAEGEGTEEASDAPGVQEKAAEAEPVEKVSTEETDHDEL